MEAIRKLENIKLAIVFVALNVIDGIFTLALFTRGGYELNPIMRQVLACEVSWVFWLVKIGATLAFASLLLLVADRYYQQINRIFLILIGVMTGICIFNGMGLVQGI